MQQVVEYQIDFFQRSVLFLDTLRERANNLFAHDIAGMPPLLDFDYEVILDQLRGIVEVRQAVQRVPFGRRQHGDSFAFVGRHCGDVVMGTARHACRVSQCFSWERCQIPEFYEDNLSYRNSDIDRLNWHHEKSPVPICDRPCSEWLPRRRIPCRAARLV